MVITSIWRRLLHSCRLLLFPGLYTVLLLGLEWSAPGYSGQMWNVKALSGVLVWGLPLEELLFGCSFGLFWASVNEHFTWKRSVERGFEH